MLKNGFDLASGYAREPLQKIVDGRTVLDVLKQGAHRYTSSLENPIAANAAWVLFNTSALGPLNHHAVMLPPCCGKLNRDFISRVWSVGSLYSFSALVVRSRQPIPNAQQPTSNAQRPGLDSSSLDVGCWMLVVGCSIRPVG